MPCLMTLTPPLNLTNLTSNMSGIKPKINVSPISPMPESSIAHMDNIDIGLRRAAGTVVDG